MACKHLRSGEDVALAGGVNLTVSPRGYVATTLAGMLTPDGRCKTLDEAADGYGRSEACNMMCVDIVCREESSMIILGSHTNQDGRSSSLTAPYGPSQQDVVSRALEASNTTSGQLVSIEMHGTGTPLGDPIEVGALQNVVDFGLRSFDLAMAMPIRLGAAKSMRGHAEAAAGSVGLFHVNLE
eukprot:scaffold673726_cov116-Prasinocladus_malaysianus.AAC.1